MRATAGATASASTFLDRVAVDHAGFVIVAVIMSCVIAIPFKGDYWRIGGLAYGGHYGGRRAGIGDGKDPQVVALQVRYNQAPLAPQPPVPPLYAYA